MRADRIIQKTKEVLMTQACSLASAAAHIYFPSSRSVILPPISDYRSFVTMSEVVSLNDIAKQKKTLRSIVRKELKALSPTQRSQEDIAIQNIVLEASWFKSSKSICAYISCDSLREVNTSKILSAILYNTAEVMQATDPVDLFLVPGVAFDRSGRRLGRGGGYYDMLLKKYQDVAAEQKWKQPLLVALSYSLQIMEEGVIPVTPNDVPVDALVSPAGVIPISPAAFERM
ncbi:5-formyltetrahydrofolate cyclo-ligase, mitochondrial-like isoform X3 [Macadamia integrifolia]|uniref:5-formyltetrahydrofolate cyclo-ligase, mitochondrial-like isoform X3 n=1 Tax=Macadamia integrifolia TaxID=60698 RepID=UPI001C4EEF82|nr:5-formyltetrahydrofolate cyclo-ligase, mitochondrial-like isoform X3 [Macadamia integrifolia]